MPFPIDQAIRILKKETQGMQTPVVTEVGAGSRNTKTSRNKIAFQVLISTILSLRTKDETTRDATLRLFKVADTCEKILKLSTPRIQKLIYPVGFYKVKAKNIKEVCKVLLKNFDGQIPKTVEELVTFKGVGRKTANLVVSHGWRLPAICVDIHVHRISNRWGYVKTKTPDETEFKLRDILPKKHWLVINDLLVTYGQNLCRPISPFCSQCALTPFCKQIDVSTKR